MKPSELLERTLDYSETIDRTKYYPYSEHWHMPWEHTSPTDQLKDKKQKRCFACLGGFHYVRAGLKPGDRLTGFRLHNARLPIGIHNQAEVLNHLRCGNLGHACIELRITLSQKQGNVFLDWRDENMPADCLKWEGWKEWNIVAKKFAKMAEFLKTIDL